MDDEVAVLLTMKAVLEISGFEVETAASAREGKARLRTREYQMVITDMRMESDVAGHEVVEAARSASYHPAVALLTAFPVDEGDWQEFGAPTMLLKPMHTRVLLEQIEQLFVSHEQKLARLKAAPGATPAQTPKKKLSKPAAVAAAKKSAAPAAKRAAPAKVVVKKSASKAVPVAKNTVKKAAAKASKSAKKVAAKPASKPAPKKVAKALAKSTAKPTAKRSGKKN